MSSDRCPRRVSKVSGTGHRGANPRVVWSSSGPHLASARPQDPAQALLRRRPGRTRQHALRDLADLLRLAGAGGGRECAREARRPRASAPRRPESGDSTGLHRSSGPHGGTFECMSSSGYSLPATAVCPGCGTIVVLPAEPISGIRRPRSARPATPRSRTTGARRTGRRDVPDLRTRDLTDSTPVGGIPPESRKLSRGSLFRSLGGIVAERAEHAVENGQDPLRPVAGQPGERRERRLPSGSPAAIRSVAAPTLPHTSTRRNPRGALPRRRRRRRPYGSARSTPRRSASLESTSPTAS